MYHTQGPEHHLFFSPTLNEITVARLLEIVSTIHVEGKFVAQVTGLAQIKHKGTQGHEKTVLQLQVKHLGSTYELYCFAERTAAIAEDRNRSSTSLSMSSHATCDDSCTTALVLTQPNIPALDLVTFRPALGRETYQDYIARQRNSEHSFVLSQSVFNEPASLAQFAVLLQTIHEFSPIYDPFEYNCYWHTVTLGSVMHNEFHGLESSTENMDKRGKCPNLPVMRIPDSVEEVGTLYRAAWVTEKLRLDEAVTNHQVCAYSSIIQIVLTSLLT